MPNDRNGTTFLVLMPKLEKRKASYEIRTQQQLLGRVLCTRRILNSRKRKKRGLMVRKTKGSRICTQSKSSSNTPSKQEDCKGIHRAVKDKTNLTD